MLSSPGLFYAFLSLRGVNPSPSCLCLTEFSGGGQGSPLTLPA